MTTNTVIPVKCFEQLKLCLNKIPELFSGITQIPEENSKIFRYFLDTGTFFWYYKNTRRKTKKLPVLKGMVEKC